ncbi:hypothetical protein SAMN05216299_1034 [Nitrosospira sp. Nsp14]|uniref:hypothetical protein n=1 Tax=Nitrosospira sp. Nsp14 TaxID=1855333 RepID=UPI0008E23C90|nr:hypothetical protein [Nitrosospira sp. Nsp14]SFH21582.1 hypothetical protein SAMN05216299_1034 [Nitrosospira sp. Nsp14]
MATLRETSGDVPAVRGSHARKSVSAVIKSLIVGAACRGLIPFKLADWLIQRGGLRNA